MMLLQGCLRSRNGVCPFKFHRGQRNCLNSRHILLASSRRSQQKQMMARTFSSSSYFSSPSAAMLGMGSHKWSRIDSSQYDLTVRTALENGINTFENSQEGGDQALAAAYRAAIAQNEALLQRPVQFLVRLGYRTVKSTDTISFSSDVYVEEFPAVKESDHSLLQPSDVPKDEDNDDPISTNDENEKIQVLHNIGADYLQSALQNSALSKLLHEYGSDAKNIQLVPMIHNPEVQAMPLQDGSIDERQLLIRERLAAAFGALEMEVEQGNVSHYGVVSNGLCLPSDHPMHLSWEDGIMKALTEASQKKERDSPLHFQILQLPANLLETRGVRVAKEVRRYVSEEDPSLLPAGLDLYCQRPLSCYPDAGTGQGHPFILADFQLPSTMEKKLHWTNEMERPPELYDLALKTAMQHFDAEDLLEKKSEGLELTAIERETLDGCKLLQSLLHDLDHGLENIRSFAAHEDDLYKKIIPLIHDTFEEYDEDTGDVLKSFFGAYSLAVRHAIAKNTRFLLRKGEGGNNVPTYPDLPQETRLQDFALRHLLDADIFSKYIIGWTEPEQVVDCLEIVRESLDDKGENCEKGSEVTKKGNDES